MNRWLNSGVFAIVVLVAGGVAGALLYPHENWWFAPGGSIVFGMMWLDRFLLDRRAGRGRREAAMSRRRA